MQSISEAWTYVPLPATLYPYMQATLYPYMLCTSLKQQQQNKAVRPKTRGVVLGLMGVIHVEVGGAKSVMEM